MTLRALFLLLSLMIIQTGTAAADSWAYPVTTFRLENGLTVYLSRDTTSPEVFGMVAVKAGSKYDPVDATGMAHYLEHMLFKGTTQLGTTNYSAEKELLDEIKNLYDNLDKARTEQEKKAIQTQISKLSVKAGSYAVPGEMTRLLLSIGGTNINASTDEDMVLFYNSFPPHQMEKWLDLYSHRFSEPVFRLFQAELETVFEELNMYQDEFVYKLYEKFIASFYPNHPYGHHTILGKPEHIKNPSLSKMYNFYNTYFVPDNMALILCGNFDEKQLIRLIEQKFGSLPSKKAPSITPQEEEPFDGRKLLKANLTPLKAGGLGFRTVPKGHPDTAALEVINRMLSNSNKTGLLDRLTSDKKLLYALVLDRRLQDHGLSSIVFVPPLAGAGLNKCEKLIIEQLNLLHSGSFSEDFFQAAKNRVLIQYQRQLEDNRKRAHIIKDLFLSSSRVTYLEEYYRKLSNLTREDVVKAASAYYGENYLAFHSFTGSGKKEKIEKPGYEPPQPQEGGISDYARYFASLGQGDIIYPGKDLTADVNIQKLPGLGKLYYTANPVNSIFTLTLRFSHHDFSNPYAHYASYLENIGTKELNFQEFSEKLSSLGTRFYVYNHEGALYVKLEGLDKNCLESLRLVWSLLTNPLGDRKSFSRFALEHLADSWITRTRPEALKDVLLEYIIYGKLSEYKNRLLLASLLASGHSGLTGELEKLVTAPLDIFYTGTIDFKQLTTQLQELPRIRSDVYYPELSPLEYRKSRSYEDNTIFVLHNSRANQARCYIYIPGEIDTIGTVPVIKAFNRYFGKGMDSLFFREIRELRSLAYSAYAGYDYGLYPGQRGIFTAYLGTQADKTAGALKTALALLDSFTIDDDHFESLQQSLIQELYKQNPHFRQRLQVVERYLKAGYTSFPWAGELSYYRQAKPEDIIRFHREHLADKPFVIAIVGNINRINRAELEKIAPVRLIFPGKILIF